MNTIFFIYTHDSIMKLVEQESALLAERRTEDANGLNDKLVFDGEYDTLFKRLFLEAHSQIIQSIPVVYLLDTPTDITPAQHAFPNFRLDVDFSLWITMPDTFPMQLKKSIDIKLQQYIVDYILYRWLETKSPNDAATYFSRLENTLREIKSMLATRNRPLQRVSNFP